MTDKNLLSKFISSYPSVGQSPSYPFVEQKEDGCHYLVFEDEESLESFIRRLHRVKQNQFFTFTHYPNSLKIDGLSIEQFSHLGTIDMKN